MGLFVHSMPDCAFLCCAVGLVFGGHGSKHGTGFCGGRWKRYAEVGQWAQGPAWRRCRFANILGCRNQRGWRRVRGSPGYAHVEEHFLAQRGRRRPTVPVRSTFKMCLRGISELTVSSKGFNTQTVSGVLRKGESWDAHSIVLPMTTATAEVNVTATQADIAQEEFHEEEHQRVLGVIPNFYVTYVPNAPPMTTLGKSICWRCGGQ